MLFARYVLPARLLAALAACCLVAGNTAIAAASGEQADAPTPAATDLPRDSFAPRWELDQPPLAWTHPYGAGPPEEQDESCDATGYKPWNWPRGIFPWSERTGYSRRHVGRGAPLEGSSWLNRPYYAGAMLGVMYGEPLIDGQIDQHEGPLLGIRFGRDYDYYWAWESRLLIVDMELGTAAGGDLVHSGDVLLCDLSLQYHPWGDSRWRPFFTAGIGLASFEYDNNAGRHFDDLLWGFPVGLGLKYGYNPWTMLRLEAIDNIALGSGDTATMHNASLSVGIEWRFGGHRTSYWPWNPGRRLP